MCGICGIVTLERGGFSQDHSFFKNMVNTLVHRGPDDEGYYFDNVVMLGVRRLSIIDLFTGQQPVTNEDGTIWVINNGEIYNFVEIRNNLKNKGHLFKSKSDTEVIVHAYEEYGNKFFEVLNGMFGLALWDVNKNQFFLARDRLGIKPLFYWVDKSYFVFGSELKAIIAHPLVTNEIDLIALDQFLSLEYIPGTRTIYRHIKKVPPGHFISICDGNLKIHQYWDLSPQSHIQDHRSYTEILSTLINDSVKQHMVSDVPMGLLLSGGIDSSTILSFMNKHSSEPVKTFSIGFKDETYNELPYAGEVAAYFGTDHRAEILQPNVMTLAEKLIYHLDEPFADFSIFPTYLVSELAGQSVKVVLSGDGGDEVFGGYDTYISQWLSHYYNWLPFVLQKKCFPRLAEFLPPQPGKKGVINKAKRWIEGVVLPEKLRHIRWMIFMSDENKVQLYKPCLAKVINENNTNDVLEKYFLLGASFGDFAQMQYVDIKTYLVDDILTKVDRMTMAASIEARVPFLDHRIVEFAINLPADWKLKWGKTKVILRRTMKGHLPDSVLNKPKQGFSIPMKNWLRGPLKPMMLDLISHDSIQQRGYFEPQTIQRWIAEHLDKKINHSHRLWSLMVFEMWLRSNYR